MRIAMLYTWISNRGETTVPYPPLRTRTYVVPVCVRPDCRQVSLLRCSVFGGEFLILPWGIR